MSRPAWRWIAASVAGSHHVEQGRPCEDDHIVVSPVGGVLVMAVADGAGSARRAAEGARCATRAAGGHLCEALRAQLPQSREVCQRLLLEAMEAARSALHRQAAGGDVADFATTLLLAVLTQQWLATLQLGDGAVVYRQRSGAMQAATGRGHGEYINETSFLTSADYSAQARLSTVPGDPITGVALCSDGIEHLSINYRDRSVHVPFYADVFRFAEHPGATQADLEAFLRSEPVNQRTCDDKTLIIVVPDAAH